jgi:hypothetical protein
MGYHMCDYNCVYFYGYCLYMLHVYVYCYFNVNLCIYITYLSIHILYIKLPQEFCAWICFNRMQIENCMWHSSVWMLSMLQYVPHREQMCSLA